MQTSSPQATAGVGPRAGSRAGRSLGHPGRRERPRPGADRRHCNASSASPPSTSPTTRGEAMTMGERIMLRPHHDQVHVFSPTTGERLD
ncbi:MAG TPA: hypothetical protein VK594_00730 [Streptosporangiaceae bacterium]|nr:hypothetical protein [Streptosporangiaceae bacterium]